jgi:hypothetical protein
MPDEQNPGNHAAIHFHIDLEIYWVLDIERAEIHVFFAKSQGQGKKK